MATWIKIISTNSDATLNSLQVNQSVSASGGYSGNLTGTASMAENAISSSYASNATSASYALSASYSTQALSASYALTASYAPASDYAISASYALSASYASASIHAIYSDTASSADNFTVRGTLTAQTIIVQTITSSTEYVSGSTVFGNKSTDTHQFTGSVSIKGPLTADSFTGSLFNIQGTPTHIPFFSSSQVLADSTMFQVDNGPGQGYSIAINENGVSTLAPEALYVFQSSTSSYNVISGKGNLNSFLQLNIQNTNAGIKASSDVVATANNGDENNNYIDLGINGSNYVNDHSWWVGKSNDTYLVSVGANHYMGSVKGGDIILFTTGSGFDGDASAKLILKANNNHQMSGSLSISGSLTVLNGITGSLFGTSSWAITSSYALNGLSSSYALNSTSASYALNATSASYVLSSSFASTGNGIFSGSFSGSFQGNGSGLTNIPATGIVGLNLSQIASGSVTASVSPSFGFKVNANSTIIGSGSSVLNVSGSTGTLLQVNDSNSGSLLSVVSGSNTIFQVLSNGLVITSGSNISTGGYTGSLFGTASYALNANTASYALTSSYSLNSDLLDGKDSTIFATTGSNTFIGNQTVTGSLSTSGSNTLIGSTTLTGSLNVSGSTTQVGNNTLLGNTTLSGSIIISGSLGTGSPSVRIYGDTTHNGYIRFDPVSTNINQFISASYIYVSGSTNDLYFTQNGNGYNNTTRLRWLEGNLYTGLLNGGLITAATGSTTFNVSSGSGIIVNLNASLTDNPYPIIQYVNWGNFTNVPITYLTSSIQSYIAINDSGSIYQQNTPYNDGQYNTLITLGTVIHQNLSTVNASITYPNVAYGYKQRSYDFLKAFGPLKLSGYTISPSSSLGLTIGSGTAFADGRNYQVDPNNPSYITDPGTSVSKIFRYYQSGSTFIQDTNGGLGYTAIDPTQYNNNGTLTTVPTAGANLRYTIQRVFWYPNSATKGIVVYYGNTLYTSLTEAAANIQYETFSETENTKQNAVYLGAIAIAGNGNFTTSTSYAILPGGIFRSVGGSGGGGSVVTTRLSDLSDVAISGPTDHQPLAYDTTAAKWTNQSTITATLNGNADTATSASYALTASYVLNSISASHASNSDTASYVLNAVSASYSLSSISASYALNSTSASYAINSTSASYAINSTSASYASNSTSASYSLTADNAVSASYASTSSYADNFTVGGTLTAQTIIVQTITSSVEYVTGSTQFGSQLSNTHQFTGSVSITGSLAVNDSNVILTNQTSSMSVATASYVLNAQTASYVENAQTASYVLNTVSASYALNSTSASYALNTTSASYALNSTNAVNATSASNFVITNTLVFDNTLTDTAVVASSILGSNNVFTRATGSYTSAFFKYTVANGTNARSGEVMAVWNGTSVQYTDFSTLDIGSTRPIVSASVAIVGTDVQFNMQTNTSGWSIKSLVTFI